MSIIDFFYYSFFRKLQYDLEIQIIIKIVFLIYIFIMFQCLKKVSIKILLIHYWNFKYDKQLKFFWLVLCPQFNITNIIKERVN